MKFFHQSFPLVLVLLMNVVRGSLRLSCGTYGRPHRPHYEPFIPAPPGHTPRCAKPGQTFCETPDHYPQNLIKFLVEKCSYDYSTILKDESDYDFNVRTSEPEDNSGYSYSRPEVPQFYQHSLAFLQEQYHRIAEQSAVVYPPSPKNDSTQEGYTYPSPAPSINNPFLQFIPHKYVPVVETLNQNPTWWINQHVRRSGSVDRLSRTQRENPLLQYTNKTFKKRQASPDIIPVCPTKSQFIMPKAALNNRGNWKYVVNNDESIDNYSQLIKSEVCTMAACSGLCELPSGYTSRCEQQYVQKRLVALEGSGNRLYTDIFWFPHGCSCQIQPKF